MAESRITPELSRWTHWRWGVSFDQVIWNERTHPFSSGSLPLRKSEGETLDFGLLACMFQWQSHLPCCCRLCWHCHPLWTLEYFSAFQGGQKDSSSLRALLANSSRPVEVSSLTDWTATFCMAFQHEDSRCWTALTNFFHIHLLHQFCFSKEPCHLHPFYRQTHWDP